MLTAACVAGVFVYKYNLDKWAEQGRIDAEKERLNFQTQLAQQERRSKEELKALDQAYRDSYKKQLPEFGRLDSLGPKAHAQRTPSAISDQAYSDTCERVLGRDIKDPESIRILGSVISKSRGATASGQQYDTIALLNYSATNSYGGRVSATGICNFLGDKLVSKYST